jgi:hypothetical protein
MEMCEFLGDQKHSNLGVSQGPLYACSYLVVLAFSHEGDCGGLSQNPGESSQVMLCTHTLGSHFCFWEAGSHCVFCAGLELQSSYLSLLDAGIASMHHHTQLKYFDQLQSEVWS